MSLYCQGFHGAKLWDVRSNTQNYSDRTWTHTTMKAPAFIVVLPPPSSSAVWELTSLRKYLVHQGVSVSARSLSSFLCRSSRARLCSVALSMSPSRRDSVTCCHSFLQNKVFSVCHLKLQDCLMHFFQNRSTPSSYTWQTNPDQSMMVQCMWKGFQPSLIATLTIRSR